MTFADLLPGDAVFVDANMLVYHFAAHAPFGQGFQGVRVADP